MPPVTNTSPAQEPKKPGFFARLFGKKKESPVVSPTSSFTPPPQLTDRPGSTLSNDASNVSVEQAATPSSTEPVANTVNQTGLGSPVTVNPVGEPDSSLSSEPNTAPSLGSPSLSDVQPGTDSVADSASGVSPVSDNPVPEVDTTGLDNGATTPADGNNQQPPSDQTVSLPK